MSAAVSSDFPIYKAERFGSVSCALGESPVWDASGGTVAWVDSASCLVHQIDVTSGAVKTFEFSCPISAIVGTSDGRFMASTRHGFAIIEINDDAARLSFGPGPQLAEGWRMNDGACDQQGRYWSGSMAPDTSAPDGLGTMFSIDGNAEVVERGGRYRTQNGLAWSLDGRTMYVSDSHRSNPHVMAYDFDGDDGAMANGRVFADTHTLQGGRPDGAAVDADDCYWIAASDSGRVLRLTPDGKVDAAVEVDVPNPTNICFIGRNLDVAFITTLKPGGTGPGGNVYLAKIPHQGRIKPVFTASARIDFPQTELGLRLQDAGAADRKRSE